MAIRIRHNGRDVTLTQLAREHGLFPHTLTQRYHAGHRGEDLVKAPRRYAVPVASNSGEVNLSQLARALGLPVQTIHRRYRRGERGEQLSRGPRSSRRRTTPVNFRMASIDKAALAPDPQFEQLLREWQRAVFGAG